MVADPPSGIVTVSPDVLRSQSIESCQVTVNVLFPVLVTVTPCVWLGPSTVPVYTKGDGETLKPAEASDWSAIVKAATRTRQTAHKKIAFVLKRPACTLCFRIHVSTVMTL